MSEVSKTFISAKKCVGPSKIASILGYDRWCNRETLKNRLENGYWSENKECLTFGNDKEPIARMFYEKYKNCRVSEAPFERDKTRRLVGKSDGLIGTDGGLEIKCHFNGKTLKSIPDYYMTQVVAYMFLYKRTWWDFMSCAFTDDGKLRKCNITRVYWKNHKDTWFREWYPEILKFIEEVKWAK